MSSFAQYMDMVRRRPRQVRARHVCQEAGCREAGVYPAPIGRTGRGRYWFCLEHVRVYNKSYDYFEGMSAAEIQAFQKSAVVGHRPTWALGSLGGRWWRPRQEPFRLFPEEEKHKCVSPRVAKAFRVLGLEVGADKRVIKKRFRQLVKKHHPDVSNTIDPKVCQKRLLRVMGAYKVLKERGLC